MKKNMSFKIIATVGLWAAIGLTACKAPQLSPDGERAVLPEGDGHTYDTAFVKPLEWNVFFQDSILQGYVEVALQNNYSFKQSMERVTMSRANLQRAKGLLLPEASASGLRSTVSANIRWTEWGIARLMFLPWRKTNISRTLTVISDFS